VRLLFDTKRVNFIVILILFLFTCIIGKLIYLQVIKKEQLTLEVTSQRALETRLKPIRGNIYDRNMIPFTETEQKDYAVIIPNFFSDFQWVSGMLSKFTDYSAEEIHGMLTEGKPVVLMLNDSYTDSVDAQLQVPGIEVVKLGVRYGEHSLARHVIGYINHMDNSGYTGIEKAFDRYLATDKYQAIGMISDASKRSIPGLGYKIVNGLNESHNVGVRLTLDYHIQKIVEEVMDRQIRSGAVIVTDVTTGNIVALASRPNYSQNHVAEYLNHTGDELMNKAFFAYDAGSVFKIVVSAAALENNIVNFDTPFQCNGFVDVDGMAFACHKTEGHGSLNFLQGFSQSCNPVFIHTGLNLGYNTIIRMAKRFGFGMSLELYDGMQQQSGNIPEKKYTSSREIANISIGQGEILVTPLQVVDMITAIANNGVRKKLNLVDAVVTNEGNIVKIIRREEDSRAISEEVAKKIQTMMHEATISGTGKNANLDEYGGAAGKTGSAETGWIVNGETKVHAWFAGFFPVNQPKYAAVVFVENGRQGGTAAAPVFKEIGEKILDMY